ncbi:MAG: class I SAM-dependent RNA methyltransferase, partial [Syntrophothermus sp.]
MNNTIFEKVLILDAGSEGKAVARVNDRVIFVPFVVPGDIVDIKIVSKKKSFFEGIAIKIHHYSEKRTLPFCEHFGTCGGCRWQNMEYSEQLHYKLKQVEDNFQRIGHIEAANILPILPSSRIKYYRNKLEYTFSNHRWLTDHDRSAEKLPEKEMNALGYHIPLMFDKILDISNCYLQPDPSNSIRLIAKEYAQARDLEFYNVRQWKGFLRNLLIRNTLTGDLMVIMVFRYNDEKEISAFLDHLAGKFPEITSLYYVINDKKNDIINDLDFVLYRGKPFMTEKFLSLKQDKMMEYRIGPASFFQTNSEQAINLYRIAGEMAEFTGDETVYDLYTGIGSIANYIASSVKKVIGIESVSAAIED